MNYCDGDMLVCNGRRFNPIAIMIRIATRGWRHAFDVKIATHTAMVFLWRGKPYSVGMSGRRVVDARTGVKKTGIYIQPIAKENIIAVRRHEAFAISKSVSGLRLLVNRDLKEDDEYDYRVWADYVARFIGDYPDKYYCSEKFYLWTRIFISYPQMFMVRVSPEDLHRCGCGWTTIESKIA